MLMITHLRYLIIIPILFLNCIKDDNTPRLVEYLKEERELRKRVNENEGISDSIANLQKKYNIDVEKEISKLNDNPEALLKLLEELKIEK